MKKNLFQAVKTYINGVEVGKTFTTKHLIDVVGDHEVLTWWKSVNSPNYRTHTYKSYLRRTGFLSNPKRGVWKVEKHIPEFVTLGTIEFLIGYKKIYNGLTKLEIEDKINNTQVERKCEKIIDGETTQQFLANIGMEGQMLRQLIMSQPIDEIKYLIEEREDLENIRILSEISKEKDMKVYYDFNEGILRVKKYLKDGAEKCKYELFQNIKQCDDINELEEVLQRYKSTERIVEQAIENLEQAGYIVEVFESVEDTILGGEETLIISLMLNIKIEEL
jgi:hypothetical protein